MGGGDQREVARCRDRGTALVSIAIASVAIASTAIVSIGGVERCGDAGARPRRYLTRSLTRSRARTRSLSRRAAMDSKRGKRSRLRVASLTPTPTAPPPPTPTPTPTPTPSLTLTLSRPRGSTRRRPARLTRLRPPWSPRSSRASCSHRCSAAPAVRYRTRLIEPRPSPSPQPQP